MRGFARARLLCGIVLTAALWCGGGARAERFLGVERERIERILEMGYQLDPETEGAIARLREAHPESPVPGLLDTGRLYWLQNYAEWDLARKAAFEAASDRALAVAEAYRERHPEDPDARFAVAMVELAQTIYYVDHRRWWAAFWKSRGSLRTMRRLVETYPDYHDAKLPLGMAHCYLSKTPAYLKPLAFLMRFRGDWETGIRYLREARDGGLFCRVDAGYYLGGVFIELEGDREAAREEFARLASRFPGNVKFQGMLAELERGLGEPAAARDRALALLELPALDRFDAVKGRALLTLLWASLGAGDFRLALATARRAEAFVAERPFLAAEGEWARFVAAEAHFGLGEREQAESGWRSVAEGENERAAAAARRRLEELEKAGRESAGGDG